MQCSPACEKEVGRGCLIRLEGSYHLQGIGIPIPCQIAGSFARPAVQPRFSNGTDPKLAALTPSIAWPSPAAQQPALLKLCILYSSMFAPASALFLHAPGRLKSLQVLIALLLRSLLLLLIDCLFSLAETLPAQTSEEGIWQPSFARYPGKGLSFWKPDAGLLACHVPGVQPRISADRLPV